MKDAVDAGFILGIFVAATPFVLIIRKYVRAAIRDENIWAAQARIRTVRL